MFSILPPLYEKPSLLSWFVPDMFYQSEIDELIKAFEIKKKKDNVVASKVLEVGDIALLVVMLKYLLDNADNFPLLWTHRFSRFTLWTDFNNYICLIRIDQRTNCTNQI